MDAVVEERWREERRGRLLDAAQKVFSKHPYSHASMDEIAQEAGVGKPTLYRYFPGKEALFEAAFTETLHEVEARMDAVLAREAGVRARLVGLVAAILPTFRDHLVPSQFLDGESASVDRSKRRIFREHRARLSGRLAAALAGGIRGGELRHVEVDRVAALVIGMCWSAAASLGGGEDELAAEVADLVLRGTAAPAGGATGAEA